MTLLTSCGGGGDPSESSVETRPLVESVTVTVPGVTEDLPPDMVPQGAETQGIVVTNPNGGSSGVEFAIAGWDGSVADRDALADAARAAAERVGWLVRERSYDDTTMQIIFDHPDGSALTYTVSRTADGLVGAAVLGLAATP